MKTLLIIMLLAGALLCALAGIGAKLGRRQDDILEKETRKKEEV